MRIKKIVSTFNKCSNAENCLFFVDNTTPHIVVSKTNIKMNKIKINKNLFTPIKNNNNN